MIRHIKNLKAIGRNVILLFTLAILLTQIVEAEITNSKFVSSSTLDVYEKAAVVTNGPACARVGTDILKRKGSAVDAAIASLICESIVCPHSLGLGGGFLMTIFDAATNKVEFLDARETAPAAARKDMYGGDATLSFSGGLAVAVPGELLGYWEAHQKYGKLPWKDLFEASIQLCEKGGVVTKYLFTFLKMREDAIRAEPTMSEIFINPKTKELYQIGERIKRPKLKETLKYLAYHDNPTELFYNGSIRDALVKEIQGFGGIVTAKDFSDYRVRWTAPLEAKIGRMTMYTAPPPGSGVLLAFIMNMLESFERSAPTDSKDIMWQRIVETYKWAYAKRTELGDTNFVKIDALLTQLLSKNYADAVRSAIKDDQTSNDPRFYGAITSNKEDYGTAHISVLAPDGSAVSVTSTMNQLFGAIIRSKSTGIIFNDQMDDFGAPGITNGYGLPSSPNNFIAPNKRPLSSMAPTIVLDENNKVRLVIGSAGGSKIVTALASIIYLHLFKNYDLKEAIDARRLHHQLFPMEVQNEQNFPEDTLKYLRKIGHKVSTFPGTGGTVCAISRNNNQIVANADYRRQGKTHGF